MSKGDQQLSMWDQLTRFVIVGVFTAFIDFTLTMLLNYWGMHRQAAKAVGWVFGTIAAYLLNARYTFQAEWSAKTATAVGILYGSTFLVQHVLWWATKAPLEAIGLEGFWMNTVSFIIAQGVATLTNFFLQRAVIFK